MRPVTVNLDNLRAAVEELMRASHEADIVEIAENFSVDNAAFTETHEINTTTPTVANIANFLATFLTVLQKGGVNRTQ